MVAIGPGIACGGFSSAGRWIWRSVFDMGAVAPEHALRVPLASWFRFRQAAERTQSTFLLLSQIFVREKLFGGAAAVETAQRRATKTTR